MLKFLFCWSAVAARCLPENYGPIKDIKHSDEDFLKEFSYWDFDFLDEKLFSYKNLRILPR